MKRQRQRNIKKRGSSNRQKMKQDLFRWIRIWSLTLISGAISIHAVLFPAYPLDLAAISKAFLRGFLVLFETDIAAHSGVSQLLKFEIPFIK
ncbi:hypothetical protein PoB_000962900 [Plakobranchus ocellatus]|uniref:Uncharacterized protein n=1 Tax=Plakobranchus ocellatus TaxID=259542 RepID=A0AAV3YM33_9GAST|nr:hypothetical protein PoB_000962900 [Plakobranchus ocellatus]